MTNRYYNYIRNDMLEFVPDNAKKILDVGCGAGKFGELLKQNRKCEVWGVEPVSIVADAASKLLDKVICSKFEEPIDLPEDTFDCVVFNDVLEHIIDPWEAIHLSKKLLKKNSHSRIIASIPNFRYIRNIYEIVIQKDFEYKGEGILDKTHFRFFTKKSIKRFAQDCDVVIDVIEGINRSNSFLYRTVNKLLFNQIDDMGFLQFAVKMKLTEQSLIK